MTHRNASRRFHKVIVAGRERGEVYLHFDRWEWDTEHDGRDAFPKEATLEDVRAHIARNLKVAQREVTLRERGRP